MATGNQGAGPSLESAWSKLGWAKLHLDALQADIDRTLEDRDLPPPYGVTHEYDPKRHAIVVRLAWVAPPPDRWGLRLGDFVGNLRACLDQLAWLLVERGTSPPATMSDSRRRRVYFPIHDTRRSFNAALATQLPGVRRADLAIVRRAQPYHRRKDLHRSVLALIRDISNGDKHRTVQPVWLRPYAMGGWDVVPMDCAVTRIGRSDLVVLEEGAELLRIFVRRTGPQPDAQVYGLTSLDVALDERVWLKSFCYEAVRYIGQLLWQFQPPPDRLRESLVILSTPAGPHP